VDSHLVEADSLDRPVSLSAVCMRKVVGPYLLWLLRVLLVLRHAFGSCKE
jgi:hypothetical protein